MAPRSYLAAVAVALCVMMGAAVVDAQIPGGSLRRGVLKRHNDFRYQYQARALVWSGTLAAAAQKWAKTCKFDHDLATLRRYNWGENLTWGTSTWKDAIALWTNEAKYYNYGNPQFSSKTGHFTQVVWASTTRVGCAAQRCSGGKFWVCRYYPAGNYQGMFSKMVKKRRPSGKKL